MSCSRPSFLKFIYSEKVTTFCEISTLNLTVVHMTNRRWKFRKQLWPSQNIWTSLYTPKQILVRISMQYLKFSFSEKATKIWKNLPIVLTLLSNNSCFVKKGGRFFQILQPSHNLLTLPIIPTLSVYCNVWHKRILSTPQYLLYNSGFLNYIT